MKRVLAVLFCALAIAGVSTVVGGRGGDERFAKASESVNADCRAYRARPEHRSSDVCRIDPFGPKAIPQYAEARARFPQARAEIARGDVRAAEATVARILVAVEDIQGVGSTIASLAAASLANETLDFLAAHRELDAPRLLDGLRLEAAAQPFEGERIHHAWVLAHWNDYAIEGTSRRSKSELADAIRDDSAALREMGDALVRGHNVPLCEEIARKHELPGVIDPDRCTRMAALVERQARLDAAQHGRLSSAER